MAKEVEGVTKRTTNTIVSEKIGDMFSEVRVVYELPDSKLSDYMQGQLDLIEEGLRLVLGNFIGDNS